MRPTALVVSALPLALALLASSCAREGAAPCRNAKLPGVFEVQAGASSRDIRLKVEFELMP